MTDSIDNKSKEKRDNLDTMLDEAESALAPLNAFDDDEDAIDRLLMNVGFDADDALIQAEVNSNAAVVKDVDLRDELDEFLSFEGFGATFNELENAQADAVDTLEQTGGNTSLSPLNGTQDDEDDLDRLLMNTDLNEDDDAPEELDDFSDFSDFNEPENVPAADVEVAEQAEENSAAGATDELDDFFSLNSDFDESDLIQDDELEPSASAGLAVSAVVEASDRENDGEVEELDDFSDFSDFNEPENVPAADIEVVEQAEENSAAVATDELDDFFSLNSDFDESDLIQDDELEPSALADLAVSAGVEASDRENDGEVEVLDDFSDFSDFNEPDIIPTNENEAPEQVAENVSADDAGLTDEVEAPADLAAPSEGQQDRAEQPSDDEDVVDSVLSDAGHNTEDALGQAGEKADELVGDADLSDEIDEFSDFDGFGDDFDESDLIQDDEVEASSDLAAPSEELSTSTDRLVDDENAVDSLLVDDFSGFGDDFDVSDLIQDDEVEAPADLAAPNEEQSMPVDQPVDDENAENSLLVDDFSGFGDDFDVSDLIQDDEVEASTSAKDANSFDSLFADADFGADDALEQTTGKKDEFGDDTDLTAIDDFFQLDEVSDSFSDQAEGEALEETDKPSDQEDDFLLPDFDITADSEISDAGIKDGEIADVFGDADFLNEGDGVQALEPGITELKSGGNEAVAESKAGQTSDTVVQEVGDVKLNPFGFEQEDMKRQLEEAENKVKKSRLFSYVAMGVGAVAFSAAAGLGVMIYGAKTEVSKLTETVSTLEASLAKSAANSPNKEIDAMRNSVVQLNQQVDGFITELKGNPQFPVDMLTNKVPDIVAKQDMVSKALDMLQVKMGGLEGKSSTDSPVVELPKVEAAHEPAPATVKQASADEHGPTKEEAGHEHAQVKELVAHESTDSKEGAAREPGKKGTEGAAHESPKKGTEHEPVSAKETVAHEQSPTKEATAQEYAPTKERAKNETAPAKVEAAPVAEPVKAENQPEPATAKPITPAKAVVKEEPVSTKQAASGEWGVNLGAFKQEWFAKSKAAEYARQGVFAEVVPVPGKNSMMYRLRVGGFKNKAEANSNTARIKQALNLDSVWVSDN